MLDMIKRLLAGFSENDHFEVDRSAAAAPVVVTDKDRVLHPLAEHVSKWEKTQDAPYRRRGIYTAADVPSFVRWMRANMPDGAPVFASGIENINNSWKEPRLSFVGIGNYAEKGKTGWHDFRAVYQFPISEQWKTWALHHEEVMDQGEFAEFIENRIYDLASPVSGERLSEAVTRFIEHMGTGEGAAPSRLVELSRGLSLTAESKLEQQVNIASGERQLRYSEEHKGQTGAPISVPRLFYIRIPIFYGHAPVLVGVRLSYRAAGGAVKWWYSLFAPEVIVGEQFDLARHEVESDFTVYLGTADQPPA